jgi:hypothetical protein
MDDATQALSGIGDMVLGMAFREYL